VWGAAHTQAHTQTHTHTHTHTHTQTHTHGSVGGKPGPLFRRCKAATFCWSIWLVACCSHECCQCTARTFAFDSTYTHALAHTHAHAHTHTHTHTHTPVRLQIALFIIMWVAAALYYWYLFRPFRVQLAREIRQVRWREREIEGWGGGRAHVSLCVYVCVPLLAYNSVCAFPCACL